MVVSKFNSRDLHEIANSFSPYTIGFDQVFQELNKVVETSNNYPPYNIVEDGENKYVIELAIAGFTEEEISITQVPDGNKLVVNGKQESSDVREYIHRGIASRNFSKTFVLKQDVQVTGASFDLGILKINLEHIVPEELQPREIKIGSKQFLQD